jgi:squalene-hopene/tetraprenyl-beta-curcumene cyclase
MRTGHSGTTLSLVAGWIVAVLGQPLFAADKAKETATGPNPAVYQAAVTKGINYLRTKGQAKDGSYSAQAGPGVTALVTTGLLRNGRTPDDPVVAASLKYLEGMVREDGGISAPESLYRNYETCLAMLCFKEANRDGRYDKVLKRAEALIKGLQWDGGEGHDESSTSFGGAGYGNSKRPDLSNTTFFIDALKATGNGPDDEAMKKALVFISRCQNLETEHNTTAFAAKNPDGGFYYTIAAGGSSQAGATADGGLRSYGSMTYAGLKSMIFAGVGPDDPRVKAAFQWVQKHYSLEENPGMGKAGLYYYYHTFAKALDALDIDVFMDSEGVKHDWRRELVEALAKQQKEDGSWANETVRWMEGDPNLATGYALLTLSYCRPKPAASGAKPAAK